MAVRDTVGAAAAAGVGLLFTACSADGVVCVCATVVASSDEGVSAAFLVAAVVGAPVSSAAKATVAAVGGFLSPPRFGRVITISFSGDRSTAVPFLVLG